MVSQTIRACSTHANRALTTAPCAEAAKDHPPLLLSPRSRPAHTRGMPAEAQRAYSCRRRVSRLHLHLFAQQRLGIRPVRIHPKLLLRRGDYPGPPLGRILCTHARASRACLRNKVHKIVHAGTVPRLTVCRCVCPVSTWKRISQQVCCLLSAVCPSRRSSRHALTLHTVVIRQAETVCDLASAVSLQ